MEICVTGGIACGKTMVAGLLADMGFAVVEADAVCHALMRAGTPVHRAILDEFGDEIAGVDGEINRPALGALVFADARRLARLNALLHPPARAAIERWRSRHPEPRAAIIPLLYEAGWADDWEMVVCVAVPPAVQFERLRQRGLDAAAARARLAAQWPVEEKMRCADYVLYNSGSPELLRRQVETLLANRESTHGREKKQHG